MLEDDKLVWVRKQEGAREDKDITDSMALPKQTDLFEIAKHEYVVSTDCSIILLILVTWTENSNL